jgi:holin-like protein
MKNIKAFAIILLIWFAGELLSNLINNIIVIPGSILGFMILFLLLQFRVLKVDLLAEMADFFLGHMTLLLIPIAISFISYFKVIGESIVPILMTGVVVTIVSMVLTMKFVDILVSVSNKRRETKK